MAWVTFFLVLGDTEKTSRGDGNHPPWEDESKVQIQSGLFFFLLQSILKRKGANEKKTPDI